MALPIWRILIVDDEPAFRKTLRRSLTASGHSVEEASSGGNAVDSLSRSSFEFVLLDLSMPGMGGVSTCPMIRSIAPRIGIVVLSVRNSEQDRVTALDAGADDYLTKPFGLGELIARLHAIHRRTQTTSEEEPKWLKAGDLQMDLSGHLVWRSGKLIHLSPKEFELLTYLMKNQGRLISQNRLLREIWGPNYGNEFQYLRNYVNVIRKKIEADPASPEYILTEPRLGYRFRNPASADSFSPKSKTSEGETDE